MRLSTRIGLGLVPLGLSLACASADITTPLGTGPLTRESLQGTWLETTQHEGKAVILGPCDASVRQVTLEEDKLTVAWGQDASEYTVQEVRTSPMVLELQVVDKYSEPKALSTISVRRTKQGLVWTIADSTLETVPESSPLPRFKECCGSTEQDPIPHRIAVVPADQPCP